MSFFEDNAPETCLTVSSNANFCNAPKDTCIMYELLLEHLLRVHWQENMLQEQQLFMLHCTEDKNQQRCLNKCESRKKSEVQKASAITLNSMAQLCLNNSSADRRKFNIENFLCLRE